MTSSRSLYRATVAFVFAALGALQGCGGDGASPVETPALGGAGSPGNQGGSGGAGGKKPTTPTKDNGFVSDSPSRSSSGNDAAAPGAGQGAGGSSSGAAGGSNGDKGETVEDPQKVIEEADIVQLRGSTLYTLSRYSGLGIVDVSDASHLKMLGRYPLTGEPFEMYVRDNTVLAMFSSWGRYECTGEGDSCKWVTSSHIAALDIGDPANVTLQGSFDLPGEISDSRIVGDVLYAVSYEDGYCWNCDSSPNTTVTSLSLKNTAAIKPVDKLTYASESGSYGWWRRSISVTQDRMYVAGVEWKQGEWSEGHSTIQVIDISDPSGKLVKGAAVEAKGQIESRWQMDEHQGVLRVISQPGQWNTGEPPRVQTFQVESAQKLVPLAAVDIKLPMPERLRSVRFDGDRAFAITAVQKDPLFTFDLSDPADPKQLGELEMPGWVYHMEPRGDRLLALGFDNGNPEGALNASLFDVSDMTKPTLMTRVHFGGNWGNFAEDQDRIHKAFTILEDKKLIMVPFAGWEYTEKEGGYWGCGAYKSGIQLIDYNQDSLAKRGVAPQRGQARRAFLKDDKLFSLSDEKLRTFDINDRDNPSMLGDLSLSHKVSRTVTAGDKLVRLSADWWTNEARLEVVPLVEAERVEPQGLLDLTELTGKNADNCYNGNIYGAQLFTHGSLVYMVWGDYQYWWEGSGYKTEQKTHVATFDVSDGSAPKMLAHTSFPFTMNSYGYGYGGEWGYDGGYYGGYYGQGLSSGATLVQLGTTLALRRWSIPEGGSYQDGGYTLEVLDLSDPANPTHASSLPIAGGDELTGMSVSGTSLFWSHSEPVPQQPGKVRFYLDRVDLSSPASPVQKTSLNVPGSLLRFDAAKGELITVDYKRTTTPADDWSGCFGNDGYYYGGYGKWFDYQNKECVTLTKSLRLSSVTGESVALLDSLVTDSDDAWLQNVIFSEQRLFGLVYSQDPVTHQTTQSALTVWGFGEGQLKSSTLQLEKGKSWYYGSFQFAGVSDESAVLMSWANQNTVFTLDSYAIGQSALKERDTLRSWASETRVDDGLLIASLEDRGVQAISLK